MVLLQSAQFRRIKTAKDALIGARGVAITVIKPKGEVRVMGEFWEATAKDTTITAGQRWKLLAWMACSLSKTSPRKKLNSPKCSIPLVEGVKIV